MNIKHRKRHRHGRAQAWTDWQRAKSSRRPSRPRSRWVAVVHRFLGVADHTTGQQTAYPIVDMIVRPEQNVPDGL